MCKIVGPNYSELPKKHWDLTRLNTGFRTIERWPAHNHLATKICILIAPFHTYPQRKVSRPYVREEIMHRGRIETIIILTRNSALPGVDFEGRVSAAAFSGPAPPCFHF